MPVFVFDQWTREIGSDDDEAAGFANPNGAFTASNMMLYRTGLFGPRPGVRNILVTSMTAGDALEMAWRPAQDQFCWVLSSGTAVKTSGIGGGAQGSVGSFSATSVAVMTIDLDTESVLMAFNGSGSWELMGSGPTLTQLSATYGNQGYGICNYRDRVYVGHTNTHRIVYSAAGDRTTFPDDIVVGDEAAGGTTSRIRSMAWIGDSLYIVKRHNLFVLDGSPISGRLRRLAPHDMFSGVDGALKSNGVVGVGAEQEEGDPILVGNRTIRRPAPQLRDILQPELVQYNINSRGTIFGATHHATTNHPEAIMHYEGLWTKHSFSPDINMSTMAPEQVTGAGDVVVLCNNDSTNPAFYSFIPSLDRPGFTTDTYSNVGDDTTTPNTNTWSTAIIAPENGARVMVRKIRIWFDKWNTGSATNEGFTVQVEVVGDPDASTYARTAATHQFSEAAANGSDVVDYYVGDQGWGTGFRLNFTGVHGVAFRRINVYYEVEDDRP